MEFETDDCISTYRATSHSARKSSSREPRSKTDLSHNGSVYELVTQSGMASLRLPIPHHSLRTLNRGRGWMGAKHSSDWTGTDSVWIIDTMQRGDIGVRPASVSKQLASVRSKPRPILFIHLRLLVETFPSHTIPIMSPLFCLHERLGRWKGCFEWVWGGSCKVFVCWEDIDGWMVVHDWDGAFLEGVPLGCSTMNQLNCYFLHQMCDTDLYCVCSAYLTFQCLSKV